MNEVIENILSRRSVRVYSDEQIRQEDLDLILKAGYNAPSGCNMQPWHFTVVQNKDLMTEMNVESKKEFADSENEMFRKMAENEKYDIFYNAPTTIIVSGEKTGVTSLIDCSAATQNMILAANSLSIGSCWVGLITYLFKSQQGKEYIERLQIPEGYEPYYAITLGYKKFPNPKMPPRREGIINYIK